jgi:repressor LexA
MFTTRQKDTRRKILEFVLGFHDENCTFPTVREIQRKFGFRSTNSVQRHLTALAKMGSLNRLGRKARSFEIPGRSLGTVLRVPLLGTIPAGFPEAATPEPEAMVAVDRSHCFISGRRRVFAVRVRGASMTGASIEEGDIAILEDKPPRIGDIVAALVDGEVTLKRLVRLDTRHVLRAENPDFPEITPRADLQVQGVLVSIQRKIE